AERLVAQQRLRGRDRRLRELRAELAAVRRESDLLAQELRAEARTDPLTGLGNRRRWEERLALELERAGRHGTTVAVALVDLDRFKQVNDSHGHAAGDALLKDVAGAFAESVRAVDLVARVGGEEFGLALPDVGLPDALHIVERVRRSAAVGVTASAGVALWDGAETADALVERADRALYAAKAAGRDRLVVA
ncbi:MAG: GGDEF domain-containing protein, partial [Actinomycetota bacterium]|nr:GGDEF domain-containing protein [Actinomycetota bacterium]